MKTRKTTRIGVRRLLVAICCLSACAATLTQASDEPCASLSPTIIGTEEADWIFGTPFADVIFGLGGDDYIFGLMGNDTICAGAGNDVVIGGVGADMLDGGDGDDVIFGSPGRDELLGADGQDMLFGGFGRDLMYGGPGDDTLLGEQGRDTAHGGTGDDVLDGGYGRDLLDGGRGNDWLTGGHGNDECDGYVGLDNAETCETERNVGLMVKQVQIPVPGGFVPASGVLAGQRIDYLDGALFVPRNSRKIAMVGTHGTFGRYYTSLTGWLGWWMELNGITVLTLNRRDSGDYGANEGGGGTIYEDTLCDIGRGVDYLIGLGYEKVIIQGHSKGTAAAPVYPVYYNNCPGKEGMTAANDPNVAGVVTTGTLHETRESGMLAPWGSFYDESVQLARDLVDAGLGAQIYPVFPAEIVFVPGQPPVQLVVASTPDSLLSYWDNPLRDVRITAKDLIVPYMVIHTEGDLNTLREWSDTLVDELRANGNDVTYFRQDYTSLGYPAPLVGTSAHQIANADARDEAMAEIRQWMIDRIPGSQDAASGIDMATIETLPDFDPPLIPTPTNP